MRQPIKFAFLCAAAVALFLLAGCASQPTTVPEGLSVGEIFQRAQDASDGGNYSTSILFYSQVEKSYPADIEHVIWAQYEIAFLYHKMGKNDTAISLLTALLDRYAKEGAALPPAPRALAQDLKTRLESALPKKQ
jgi:outer membrane protein assembly factor BamD (BamD/ComL family)